MTMGQPLYPKLFEVSCRGYTLPGDSVFWEDRMGEQNPKTDSGKVVPGNRNIG